MLRKTLAFFKFSKQEKEKFNNSICEKVDETTNELKESRKLQSIEFYNKVKNDKSYAFAFIESNKFLGVITQSKYEISKEKINEALVDVEKGKISKEDFYEICFMRNK